MLALVLLSQGALAGANLSPADFAWRATVAVPPGAAVVRVALPAEALVHLQSAQAADLRIFNAAGVPVAHTVLAPDAAQASPVALTRSYPAYTLYGARVPAQDASEVLQLRLDRGAQGDTVWAHLGTSLPQNSATLPAALPAVLFDTRNETQLLTALQLQARLPANMLVPIMVEISPDLTQWQAVPVTAPVLRFEGEGAPSNDSVRFVNPVQLKGHYLRLSWSPQYNVELTSLQGQPVSAVAPVQRPSALLPAAPVEGERSQTWALPFGVPVAEFHLTTNTPNTWLPLQVQARRNSAQPWFNVGQAVVFRLDAQGQAHSNPPMTLSAGSVRWLRVQSVGGMSLGPQGLQARVAFDPVTVAFLAQGSPPFTLAVGRENTTPAAVDRQSFLSSLPGRPQDLPWAILHTQTIQKTSSALPSWASAVLPAGATLRDVLLWSVLLGGVLSLAAVAVALLRQMKRTKPNA